MRSNIGIDYWAIATVQVLWCATPRRYFFTAVKLVTKEKFSKTLLKTVLSGSDVIFLTN